MPERKRGDPKSISLDIPSSQIEALKAEWDAIDVDEYTIEGLQHLEKSQGGTLFDHLIKRASAIGKEQAPNDENEQANIARNYILGALFIDKVTNTMPEFDQEIESNDLTRFHNYLDSLPDNPYHSLGQVAFALAPNLKTLILRVAEEGKDPNSKNNIGTGCIEMYSIKIMKVLGSLPPPRIFKS